MLALAETLVSAFCHALGFSGPKRRPRVDVFALAECVGAELVISSRLLEDGRVEDTSHATRIYLDGEPVEERRRFTLGHELGHLVLSDPKVFRLVRPQFNTEKLQVEQLCNAFAAELLMPRKWIVKYYEDEQEGLDALLDVANSAEVSLSAGLTRLMTVLRWQSSLLYFQRNRNWAPLVTAGRSRLQKIKLGKGTEEMLWSLHDSEKTERREIALLTSNGRLRVSCEMRPTATGVVCLAHLPASVDQSL